MINWKQKLSSRKFWVALVGFITSILVAFNVPTLTVEQVTAIVMGSGTLIAYILSEGFIDAKRVEEASKDGDTTKATND